MLAQEYWNGIGSKKDFEDPIYLDKLSRFLSPQSQIIEYGCGYGRAMRILRTGGYQNLVGFDFALSMITRGKQENPDLDLRFLDKPGTIPFPDESQDAVVISTVLCCIADKRELAELMSEILRVLRKKGVLYITDFLVCEHPRYRDKYAQGMQKFGEWGVYTTNENLTVRHFSAQAILDLLKEFEIEWFEQFDFKTMNQNPARTFHCIARKAGSTSHF